MNIPFRTRGRRTEAQKEAEQRFADELVALAWSLDFKLSARGWCYHLEPHGLAKGDFDRAESLINSLREDGILPVDLVAVSQQRVVKGLEHVDDYTSEESFAEHLRDIVIPLRADMWIPFSQWDTQPNYVELMVEKIDLVGLFRPVCAEFGVTITNMQGWSDPLTRATQMKRFVRHKLRRRNPIALYVTDLDPDGPRIAELLTEHYNRLSRVRWMDGSQSLWTPDSVRVVRIGLDKELIDRLGLTWIDGLGTGRKNADGSKRDLSDPSHPCHNHAYVQEYLQEYGNRKVEANALVTRIEAARDWLRGLLPDYIDVAALSKYRRSIERKRKSFLRHVSLELRGARQ
jgi:hypothetical protein